ncbi:MAG: monovalent cation/H+ antiporter subunit D family protein [Candidatus Hydrothermarchaeales archaeon]
MPVGVVMSMRPALAVFIPLICAFLILVTGDKHRNLRDMWSLTAALAVFMLVASIIPIAINEFVIESPIYSLVRISPILVVQFRVDSLGAYFGGLSAFMWLWMAMYSIGYLRYLHERNQSRFLACFALVIAAGIGIAFAGNLFTLFIFYEIMSVSAYPLIIHHETEEAMRAGRKYLMYVLIGGVFVLGSMAMTYVLAGTLTLSQMGILSGTATPNTLRLLFLTFVIGFGVKSAIMPLHGWLPASMVAPTPANALLSVVEAGVFGIARLVYNIYGVDLVRELGLGLPLAYVATITILLASVYAWRQDNLKRRLAYSTVSQLSYVILGVALMTPNSALGGIIHIVHQAFMKNTLFFCAGAIFVQTGKKNISEMRGLAKSMPLTMTVFAISALGVIGIPPMVGFLTKWYLAIGALEAHLPIFLVVILISAMLNAAYYLPPIYDGFFVEPDDPDTEYEEAPMSLLAPLIITGMFVLIFGVFANIPYTPLRLLHITVKEVLHLPVAIFR